MCRKENAFTLIELLIVVAVIVLLVSILAPMLGTVGELARRVICKAGLHDVNIAFTAYLSDNGGWSHPCPTGSGGCGYWDMPRGSPLRSDYKQAYWGVAYAQYTSGQREVFHCPSAKATDCDNFPTTIFGPTPADWPSQPWISYGLNRHMRCRSKLTIDNPPRTIVCHDAHEHLLEGYNWGVTDGLSDWGTGMNITQWRNCYRSWCRHDPSRMGPHRNHEEEYYRHLGTCSVLWYDGAVTSVPESDGRDIPKEWYTAPSPQLSMDEGWQ
ncbi:MAG: prepilin-type N-terminal cleavage/methylation domain-containing protein [Planctomycetota bacterium]|jgi:prepilin-type N-terminal cleavage/methylation domain-containing protein